jgi:general secretion pathway protein I
MQRNKKHGFTLLEVMVALAIFSISLLAITRALGQSARALDHTQEKTFSHWVARNAMNEILLGLHGGFNLGDREGSMFMANKSYSWHGEVASTDDPHIWSVHVSAGNASITTYAKAVGVH